MNQPNPALFDITQWITEGFNSGLNVLHSDTKRTIVKKTLYATHDSGVELVLMEISDGSLFLPAVFNPNDIRMKFGLSDLKLSIESLEEKVIDITAYSVSAYRHNSSIFPYIIVTGFNKVQVRMKLADNLQHAHTNEQVEKRLYDVQQSIESLEKPISTVFPSNALKSAFPKLSIIEQAVEACQSISYKFKPRVMKQKVSNYTSKNKTAPTNVQNKAKRRKKQSNILFQKYQKDISTLFDNLTEIPDILCIDGYEKELIDVSELSSLRATSVKPEEPSASVDTSSQSNNESPVNTSSSARESTTLHDFILTMFDTCDEIPDALCIMPENIKVPVADPTASPGLRSESPVRHPKAPSPPPPPPTLSTRSTPSSSNSSIAPDSPIHSNTPVKDIPTQVPSDLNTFQRRRFFSNLRLQFLI